MSKKERVRAKKKSKKRSTFSSEGGDSFFLLLSYSLSMSAPPPIRQPSPVGEDVFSVDDPAFAGDDFRMFRVRESEQASKESGEKEREKKERR